MFPDVIVPVCSTARNILVGNTARYATSELHVTLHFNRKRIIPTFDKSEKKIVLISWTVRIEFLIFLHFIYLFQSVFIISELIFAFRHLISDLTLTCAITLMSAYLLNRVHSHSPSGGSLTFVQGGRVFVFFRLASCTTAGRRGLVPGPISFIYMPKKRMLQ